MSNPNHDEELYAQAAAELSQTDDKSLWAFDPLDDPEIKAYDAASEIQRDSLTGARTGLLPKEEYPGSVGAGMEGKRIPTLGADFTDTARRHASAIFQSIEIFGQSLQNFYGVDERLASHLLHPPPPTLAPSGGGGIVGGVKTTLIALLALGMCLPVAGGEKK